MNDVAVPPPLPKDEDLRIGRRRAKLAAGVAADAPVVGLALSGGGIRSATFALGVMQALNDVPMPGTPPRDPTVDVPGEEPRLSNLLARFDYLSTVSGGGYVGSFFCSLFVPGRLETKPGAVLDADAPHRAARLAIQVMANEPPGRMRIEAESDTSVLCKQPLAWLRENGRYLAPTGAGDVIYATALAIRNWLAIQYVLATVIVTGLAALMLVRALTIDGLLAVADDTFERLTMSGSTLPYAIASGLIWGIAALIVALWAFPAGIAFWLAQPDAGRSDADVPQGASLAAWGDLLIGLVLAIGLPLVVDGSLRDDHLLFFVFFVAIGVQAVLGFGFYQVSRGTRSIVEHRVVLTKQLALALQCAAAVLVFALADSLALYGYNWLQARSENPVWPALVPTLLGAAVWAVRHVAVLLDQKSGDAWWRKLPLDVLAAVAAIAIGLGLIVLWGTLINWMVWNGRHAEPLLLDSSSRYVLLLILVAACFIAVVVGRFPAFINLSSLQSLYSARLTRAYLGASNGERLRARMNSEGMASIKGGSVAEPLVSDQLDHRTYFGPDVLAPLHIINVTVNQTTDSNEQLVQRDRKGLPLAILPHGFAIDGRRAAFEHGRGTTEAPRSIGEWIGASGAAVATGLGRTTTRGLSLLLGLANVRLGTWWQSGQGGEAAQGGVERSAVVRARDWLFGTQAYLLSELTAEFYGLNRRWQYLSDGGHFENTGIYELLRPERRVALIVCCDDGADVAGRFDDLANLVRLARIDFGLELELNTAIGRDPLLGGIFGRPEELLPGTRSRKCAMLFDVMTTDAKTRERVVCSRILIVKPRVIDGAPLDVLQYAATHPTFPNESTAQQFFDEAQWESYRRLGVTIGRTVFGIRPDSDAGHAAALWKYLQPVKP